MSALDFFLGNKEKNTGRDVVADIVEMESGPMRPWDKSLARLSSRNLREVKPSSKEEGWKIRDALNSIGVESWFPKPGQKTGMLVYYTYSRVITPEELSVIIRKFEGGGSRETTKQSNTETTKRQSTIVRKSY